jgi:class 3 adenylate cyclase
VNTTARLQPSASAGQIVLSERLFDRLTTRPASATATSLALKGKEEAEPARVIDLRAVTV